VLRRRLPVMGGIEVTHRCNLRCVHCYINLPAADTMIREKELSSRQWQRLIDEIVAEGCFWLCLTGGEPLVRPDFLELYTYAKQQGLLVILFTNATLLTPKIADYLAEWPPFNMEVSVYGRTRATYEAVTGVPGSYDRCLQGIHLLLERKIPLVLKTMVLTLNQHELPDLQKWSEDLGVEFKFDPILNPRLDGSRTPYRFRLPSEEALALDLADDKRKSKWLELQDNLMGPPAVPDDVFHCGAGLNSFHIDPQGRLSPCLMVREPHYDLTSGSFREGWRKFLYEVRGQKRRKESPCNRCKLIYLCGQCPGWGQLEHGDQEEMVDYLCRAAHLRAQALGFKHSNC
jgi:radical SAM protein with 4Fe4S-binding SPASM domain